MLMFGAIRHTTLTRGFALPTVIITSVVMMIVVLAGLTATTSITSNIQEQHIRSLANGTAQAGAILAQTCIENDEISWTKLRTGDTCAGSASHCTSASCYLLNDTTAKERTWFEVEPPVAVGTKYEVQVTAYYERIRTSTGTATTAISNTVKATITPVSLQVSDFAGGQHAVCGTSDAGSAYCLGSNESYVLGNGENTTYFTANFEPVGGSLSGSTTVTDIDTNALHSCAVSSGFIYCWGTDHQGALGNGAGGSNQSVAGPVDTSGALAGKTMTKVTTGGTADNATDLYAHTCALDDTGAAYCWGSNNTVSGGGQLGDGTNTARQLAVTVLGGHQYETIDTGKWHTCAIRTDDKLYCWGGDNNGQIGNGSGVTHVSTPTAVQGPFLNTEFTNANFTKLASGAAHNCAINSDNDGMWCWGQNAQGQIGDGTTTVRHNAVKVTLPGGETGWADVVAGEYYTCGLTLAGRVYCWGGTGIVGFLQGQIGDGSTSGANRTSPTAVVTSGVLNGKTVAKLWNTWSSSIVQDTDGNGYSWGRNNDAQLGTGVRNAPAQAYSPIDAPLYQSGSTDTGSTITLY